MIVKEGGRYSSQHYPDEYYGEVVRYHPIIVGFVNYLAKRRVNYLEDLSEKGRALDIGCGQGWFVKQFVDRGWNAIGIEVSNTAAYHACNQLGLNIKVGVDVSRQLEDNHYDVIGLWHVLEHLEDPMRMLSEIRRLLKDDGRALIGVPNFGSSEAKLGKYCWFHLDVPRHLYHFNEQNLKQLLDMAGLKVVKKRYFVPEYDFYSFVQTVQNRLGIKMNLLYQTVRVGLLSSTDRKTRIRDWLGLILTTPILAVLSLLWIPIATLTHNGSSLVLILRKK